MYVIEEYLPRKDNIPRSSIQNKDLNITFWMIQNIMSITMRYLYHGIDHGAHRPTTGSEATAENHTLKQDKKAF